MSNADKIRRLLHLPNSVIATKIKCHEAYVRSVRQRTSRSGNPIERPSDRLWKERNWGLHLDYGRRTYRRKKEQGAAA